MAFQHLFCTNSASAFDLISFRALERKKKGFKVCFMFLSAYVNNNRSANRDIAAVKNYSLYVTLTHFQPSMDLFSLSVTLLNATENFF